MLMNMINRSSTLALNPVGTIAVTVLMTFWLSACSVTPSTTLPAEATIDPSAYQECVYPPQKYLQACTVQGGKFAQQGKLGCYQCVVTYADAGKACTDGSDCQGNCESRGEYADVGTANQTGQCSADSSPFGCHQVINNGVAESAICID